MQTVTTVGLDIAKSVFQVHGVDAAGQVAIRRQLKRRHVLAFFQKLPPCLIGIEADTRGGTPTQDSPNSLRERRYEAAPVFGARTGAILEKTTRDAEPATFGYS